MALRLTSTQERHWVWSENQDVASQQLGRAIPSLDRAYVRGKYFFGNQDLAHLSTREMREQRRHLQMHFSGSYASL